MRSAPIAGSVSMAVLLAGCEYRGVIAPPEASLERMIDQPKLDAYEANRFFADGRAMQRPPPGTVPFSREPLDAGLEHGYAQGAYLEEIPMEVDLALLERGRGRFEIFCATCHGVTGDGVSMVAEQMELVKPPALIGERIRAYPPGRIFRVARDGFGLMPSYRNAISTQDRWAVVAYVQALQLRDRVPLDQLPADLAREAKQELE